MDQSNQSSNCTSHLQIWNQFATFLYWGHVNHAIAERKARIQWTIYVSTVYGWTNKLPLFWLWMVGDEPVKWLNNALFPNTNHDCCFLNDQRISLWAINHTRWHERWSWRSIFHVLATSINYVLHSTPYHDYRISCITCSNFDELGSCSSNDYGAIHPGQIEAESVWWNRCWQD